MHNTKYPILISKNTFTASSLQQIIQIILRIRNKLNKVLWFRGQGAYYNLVPSLLRKSRIIRDPRGNKTIKEGLASGSTYAFPNQFKMVEKFSNISSHLFKTKPENILEWLCIMQHYRIPTTLLDWTIDPMIALFFATDIIDSENLNTVEIGMNYIKDKEFIAELWIIAPELINLHSEFNKEYIFDTGSGQANAFMKSKGNLFPIAINNPMIEERLILQKGCFTIHGSDIRPLNHLFERYDMIYKIEIPKDVLIKIRNILITLGYTHDYFYPNDDTKYKHIRNNEISRFMRWYNTYKKSLFE